MLYGKLTFEAGATEAYAVVKLLQDRDATEGDELLTITLDPRPENKSHFVGDLSASIWILNDDGDAGIAPADGSGDVPGDLQLTVDVDDEIELELLIKPTNPPTFVPKPTTFELVLEPEIEDESFK